MRPLLHVDELARRLGADDLVIIDARFSLADTGAGRRAYQRSHLPGAVYLHLDDDLSGPLAEHGGRHPLPSPAAAAATVGAAGVGPGSHVVAYDDGDAMVASRVWWLLRWLGHEHVQVLDGGFAAWREAGGPETDALPMPTPRPFEPRPRASMIVDRAWVMARLGDPTVSLVDARAPERYRGEVEPLDPRAGHIPGAVNLPYTDNLEAGRFKQPDALRERFADVAAAPTVAVYCGSGVSAAHHVLAMELAGFPGARLYAGSWSDWVSFDDAPVATMPTGEAQTNATPRADTPGGEAPGGKAPT
jgi:thiosulfate/3-mercaptopyruvate sulfurtransferase